MAGRARRPSCSSPSAGRTQARQPLTGWLGHAAPFDFAGDYQPAPGIKRFLAGTPPILSLVALEVGVEMFARGRAGGAAGEVGRADRALHRAWSRRAARAAASSSRARAQPTLRGSQVAFRHPEGYPIMQALIARGVIGDFRAPDLLRFGFAPLYVRFVDLFDAVACLRQILERAGLGPAGIQAAGCRHMSESRAAARSSSPASRPSSRVS